MKAHQRQIASRSFLKLSCGELSELEVGRIYSLNTKETLNDQPAAKLFRQYIETHRKSMKGKGRAEKLLNIYEKCREYLRIYRLPTDDEMEKLGNLGLPIDFVQVLKMCAETGDKPRIERYLIEIQVDCCQGIEKTEDFCKFKELLVVKLNTFRN